MNKKMVVDDAILERIILRCNVCKIKILCANVAVGYSRSYAQKHGGLPTLERINKIMLM
jgi:hypothetical protein